MGVRKPRWSRTAKCEVNSRVQEVTEKRVAGRFVCQGAEEIGWIAYVPDASFILYISMRAIPRPAVRCLTCNAERRPSCSVDSTVNAARPRLS